MFCTAYRDKIPVTHVTIIGAITSARNFHRLWVRHFCNLHKAISVTSALQMHCVEGVHLLGNLR
jgi:hypothetical protein